MNTENIDTKEVILFKAFKPDHSNFECLVCDSTEDGCCCLYLISEEELQTGDKFIFTEGMNYNLKPKLGYFICEKNDNLFKECETFARKVIALPGQIGWLRTKPKEMEFLSQEKIENILSNGGVCEVKMDVFDSVDGGNGYRDLKLINNKVVIHERKTLANN